VSDLADPFVNPEENTTYTVVISDGLGSITISFAVIVEPLAQQPSITVSGDSLISSSTSNNQWFYYGNPIDGATGQVFNPSIDGSYQVQVIGANGCPSPLSDPYDYLVLSSGAVLSAGQWWVAPNPAAFELSILGDFEALSFSVTLMDQTGKLVRQVENERRIPVLDLPAGVYVLRLNTTAGSGLQKVVIMH
jgi:hypothetical protein